MSDQEIKHESFVFMGRKFTLESHDSTTQKTLSIGKTTQPPFKFLFKFFNPYVQDIYFMKSKYSDKCFCIGYSHYFDSYYFVYAIEKTYFQTKEEAIKYLKKFIAPTYVTNKVEKIIYHIGCKKIPMHVLSYFADELNFEYRINEYLSLKLEKGETKILVAGEEFMQCKYLLFNIPPEEMLKYDQINSIDQAKEILDRTMEGHKGTKFHIPPIMEFTGHCSNIEAWAKHNYNTALLDSKLAFPLLRILAKKGDPQAKRVFKDEIAERYSEGSKSSREYLRVQGYLRDFTEEELISLFQATNDSKLLQHIGDKYFIAIDTDNDKDRQSILIPEEQKANLEQRATELGKYFKTVKRRSFIVIFLFHYFYVLL